MRKFILTTVLGGVLFLIPFVLVVVLLGKGFMIMRTMAEKLDLFLPWETIAGLPIVDVAAVLFLRLVVVLSLDWSRGAVGDATCETGLMTYYCSWFPVMPGSKV